MSNDDDKNELKKLPFYIFYTFVEFGPPWAGRNENSGKSLSATFHTGAVAGWQRSDRKLRSSTLYSCVPGERVLIFEPNWTNISVIAPMRSWSTRYSSYSAQKSSLYCWRCSSAVMALYFLKRTKKERKSGLDEVTEQKRFAMPDSSSRGRSVTGERK